MPAKTIEDKIAKISEFDTIPSNTLEQIISALDGSVTVIQNLISLGTPTDEAYITIKRNVDHISIVLAYPEVVNSDIDLSDYNNVVTEALQFLEDNI